MLLAVKFVDRKTADIAYRRIMKSGLVREDDMQSRFKTVSITKKGKLYLAEHGYESYRKLNDTRPFNTSNPARIHKELTKVKAVTLFRSAGVAALPSEKPVFGKLLNTYASIFKTEEDLGYAKPTQDEIQHELESTGYYYRSEEIRNFMNAQGTAMSDSIRGARFTGIYLQRTECCVVYTADPGENRMLKISESLEQRLVDLLGNYLTVSLMFNVFRTVSGESHHINAIVISDGNALVYEMVMGSKHGHIRGKQAVLKELESDRHNQRKRKHSIFRYDQELYGHVYIIPANTNGADSLYYLTTHNTENWIAEGAQLCDRFDSTMNTAVPNLNGQGVCSRTGLPLVYLPAYEVMILHKASIPDYSDRPTCGFIAPQWMHKTIRHCVRMDIPIYDSETGQPESKPVVYARDGYLEGEERNKRTHTHVRRKITTISCAKETYEVLSAEAKKNHESFSRYVIKAALERTRMDKNEI